MSDKALILIVVAILLFALAAKVVVGALVFLALLYVLFLVLRRDPKENGR